MKTETALLIGAFVVLVGSGIYYISSKPNTELTNQTQLQLQNNSQNEQTMPANQNAQTPNTKQLSAPQMEIDAAKTYTARLETTEGDITVELYADKTPKTVNNFVYLAKKNFYNDTIFHRVIKGFMIQGGDPIGNGTGGPGYRFDDEKFEGEYTRGTIAMANAGPNTNGSQFFIMHADYALPPNYVIFGKVTEGLETVDKIAEAPTVQSGEGSRPMKPVTVKKIEIIEQ